MFKIYVLSLLLTIAAPTYALAQATSSEKSDQVFLDEGDGDFDSVPTVPPQKAIAAPSAPAAAAPEAAPAVAQPAAVVPPAPEKLVQKTEPMPEPKKEHAKKLPMKAAKEKSPPPPAQEEKDGFASAPPTEHEAPATTTFEDPKPADPVAETASEAVHEATQATAHEASPAPAWDGSDEKPAKKVKAARKSARHKAEKTAGGLYVVTREACPMTREPASESPAMITVKASKRIWVEEVDEKWVRGFNKAGEPGYISRDCVN